MIVPTRKATEEEHQAVTEVETNPPPDKGTSQNKEETPLTLRKTKAESPEITGLRQMTLMTLEQLILIDQTNLIDLIDLMMNHLKEERSLRESQAEAATMGTADWWPHIRQDV